MVSRRKKVDDSLLDKVNSKAKEKRASADADRMREYLTIREDGDTGLIDGASFERIDTFAKAVAKAGIDPTQWEVSGGEINIWEGMCKIEANGKQEMVIRTMYGFRVKIRRIIGAAYANATEALFKRAATHAPRYPLKIARPSSGGDECMLEVSPVDVHIGKLGWLPESGDNYDIAIARAVLKNAVEDLASLTATFAIKKILFPIGNDYYHIDNQNNTTTAGTRVDADGRYAKIIEAGEYAAIEAIDFLLGIAPVEVLWVPGNHDATASYHLARTLHAWYRNCKHVAVDVAPPTRKCCQYGPALIGFTHGDKESMTSLPAIMSTAWPDLWAKTRQHEWHVGHKHKSKALQSVSVDTHDGVVIRTLPSLSGPDAWHASSGYIGSRRAAEAYLWSKDNGYVGHFSANARN